MEKTKQVSQCKIYTFMGLMLLTGSINTIANKLQQSQESLGLPYSGHQKFITFCMFHGEVVCFFIYLISKKCDERKKKKELSEITQNGEKLLPNSHRDSENYTNNQDITPVEQKESITNEKETNIENKEPQPKFYYFLFPALFDLVGSSLSSISLSFLDSSTYQMFRGAIIIFTMLASIIFLKARYYRHHILGVVIVIIGLTLVGLNAILFKKGSSSANPGLGIVILIISQLFSAGMFITEEKILKKFTNLSPLKTVGCEGLWGAGIYYILMVIFYNIRCEDWTPVLRDGVCFKDDQGIIRFENALYALKQLGNNNFLLSMMLLYICSIALFNFSGLTVTKLVTATARTIVDTLRTIVVWLFFLVCPGIPEKCKEVFSPLQLGGFLVLILGSVIYNEILVLRFWGFDKNTREARKKREELEKLKENEKYNTGNNETEQNKVEGENDSNDVKVVSGNNSNEVNVENDKKIDEE